MTTAFVLWGGGSLGAAQVGMLRALAEYGIRADLVIGASVGALNGAYYAARPGVGGVEELARLWLSVSGHDVYPMDRTQTLRSLAGDLPFHPVRGALRALGARNYAFPVNPRVFAEAMFGRRNHLFDNAALRRFLAAILPIDDLCDGVIPLSVLTTDVLSGRAVVLSRGPALPALLASTAIPAVFPTVPVDGRELMDGGFADRTTLDHAAQAGVDEAYLLAPGFSCHLPAPPSTAIAMALHGYNLLAELRIGASIAGCRARTRLRVLPPLCPVEILPIDFRQTADLIDRATEATLHWLERNRPQPGVSRAMGGPHPPHPGNRAHRSR
jgi:NTE family protein